MNVGVFFFFLIYSHRQIRFHLLQLLLIYLILGHFGLFECTSHTILCTSDWGPNCALQYQRVIFLHFF